MKPLLTILAITVAHSFAFASPKTMKAEVNGMVCSFCAQGIEKTMRAQAQTQEVFVDLKNRVVAVQLKPEQTISEQTFRSLIKDAGYEVVSVQTLDTTAQEIKAAVQRKK